MLYTIYYKLYTTAVRAMTGVAYISYKDPPQDACKQTIYYIRYLIALCLNSEHVMRDAPLLI
jgi:hypothetical protein